MNPKYTAGLKGRELEAQVRSIRQGDRRPKTSYRSRRSRWARAFERAHGTTVADREYIHKNLLTRKGIDKVLDKGRGAYFSSGSRPNQTPDSWALARLASVLMGGPALQVDRAIARRHGRKAWRSAVGV